MSADRVIVVEKGTIKFNGTCEDFLSHFEERDEYMNLLEAYSSQLELKSQ